MEIIKSDVIHQLAEMVAVMNNGEDWSSIVNGL